MTAFGALFDRVRETSPLVHCISNLVSANDCANIVLAAGASPIMADDPEEVEEITALSRALCLSLGTPNPRKAEAMVKAGRTAARLGLPVGGYYYSTAPTKAQADAELAALKAALAGKTFQLPVAVDVEDPKLRGLGPAKLAALVAQAAARLEAWGLYAMVYTYANFAATALDMDALAAYDLWLADYRGKRPTRPHGMWQYTSTGHVAGIDGPVDLSRAYKDYPALCRRAGLGRFSG